MSVRKLTLTGVMAAVMCVLAPWAVQIGPVPITLATLALYLIGAVAGEKYGTVAVVIYILLGMVGMPVFSGFAGGFSRIAGVTGGYIVGYIPCVFICGIILRVTKRRFWAYPLAMLLGTVALYMLGTLWYSFQTGNTFVSGFLVCVVPFLAGDIIKIVLASVFSHEINRRVLL